MLAAIAPHQDRPSPACLLKDRASAGSMPHTRPAGQTEALSSNQQCLPACVLKAGYLTCLKQVCVFLPGKTLYFICLMAFS